MQTVNSLFQGLGGGGDAGGGSGGGSGGGMSSQTIGDFRIGTSAVSALSNYAMATSKAQSLRLEAGDETLAARQEYVQAQQKTNEINRAYNATIGAQINSAAAGGIDIASGSVVEAGRQAQATADRVAGVVRNDAEAGAAQRRSRAIMLKAQADMTEKGALISGAFDIAKTVLQVAAV